MQDKNPMIPLLNQLAEIMSMIQNSKKGLGQIPQKIVDELERLEKEFAETTEITKRLSANSDEVPKHLLIETMRSPKVPESDKKAIHRAIKVGRDAEILKKEVQKVASPSSQQSQKMTDEQKLQAKARRKKFKSLEDNKKWV